MLEDMCVLKVLNINNYILMVLFSVSGEEQYFVQSDRVKDEDRSASWNYIAESFVKIIQ